jgi:hypothetical protein
MEVNIMSILLCFVYSHSTSVEEVTLAMIKKTMDLHVLPNLAFATIVASSFDL